MLPGSTPAHTPSGSERSWTRRTSPPIGHYALMPHGIQVIPGPESFHTEEGAVIHFENGQVAAIDGTGKDGQNLEAYELEPQLVTALFEGQERSKREIIRFEEIPQPLVDAVLAIEDRRFFQH